MPHDPLVLPKPTQDRGHRTPAQTSSLAMLLTLLGACASPLQPATEAPLTLVDSQWQVRRLVGPDTTDMPLPDKPPTLNLAANQRGFGYAGCNRFFAQYRQQDNNLQISHIGSTRQSCRPERNKIEQRYLRSLLETRSWEQTTEGIRLLDGREIR